MPIRDEYDYLIHLIRCAIQDQTPSELPDGALFDSVFDAAVIHELANMAYYSVEKLTVKPADGLLRKWEGKRNSAIVRDMNQSFAYSELMEKFRETGIRSIEVQGTKLKPLYPRRDMRTMSDIDFIIEPENLPAAEDILISLGYKIRNTRGVEVDGFRKPNIIIEVHTEFFPSESDYHDKFTDPFAGVTGEPGDPCEVSDEIFYLYNVLHIAKHYFREGCGIRRILDLYYLNHRYAEVSGSGAVRETVSRIGIDSFLADASELAECWFGETPRDPDPRLDEMIGIIKRAGVHGTASQRLTNKFAREKSEGVRNIKMRYVFSRLFPEKWVMLANYPVLKKYPVLTPFCWLHRSFKAITKNRGKLTSELEKLRNTEIK